MAKLSFKDTISVDWIQELQDKTKEEALEWIAENVPNAYTFYVDYGYESCDRGYLESDVRWETDEEEQQREAAAKVEQARRKKAREDEILEMAKRITKERKG